MAHGRDHHVRSFLEYWWWNRKLEITTMSCNQMRRIRWTLPCGDWSESDGCVDFRKLWSRPLDLGKISQLSSSRCTSASCICSNSCSRNWHILYRFSMRLIMSVTKLNENYVIYKQKWWTFQTISESYMVHSYVFKTKKENIYIEKSLFQTIRISGKLH